MSPLAGYARRRLFDRAAEPLARGRRRTRRERESVLVVQKHPTTQLHYEVHLEVE